MPCLSNLELKSEAELFLKNGELPNIKHPAYIHDWLEHPAVTKYLEKHTAQETEDYCNNFLEGYCKGEQIRVHIYSIELFVCNVIVADGN